MSVRPLNKRFALIVALYNCRKRDYNPNENLFNFHMSPLLSDKCHLKRNSITVSLIIYSIHHLTSVKKPQYLHSYQSVFEFHYPPSNTIDHNHPPF